MNVEPAPALHTPTEPLLQRCRSLLGACLTLLRRNKGLLLVPIVWCGVVLMVYMTAAMLNPNFALAMQGGIASNPPGTAMIVLLINVTLASILALFMLAVAKLVLDHYRTGQMDLNTAVGRIRPCLWAVIAIALLFTGLNTINELLFTGISAGSGILIIVIASLLWFVVGMLIYVPFYYTMPTLADGETDPLRAIRSSLRLMSASWREFIVCSVAWFAIFFLGFAIIALTVAGPGLVLGLLGIWPLAVVLFLAGAVAVILFALVMSTIGFLLPSILYLYTTTGAIPDYADGVTPTVIDWEDNPQAAHPPEVPPEGPAPGGASTSPT